MVVYLYVINEPLSELQGSGESTDSRSTEGRIAGSVASVAICHPIWVILAGPYRGIPMGTSGVYRTFVTIWGDFIAT